MDLSVLEANSAQASQLLRILSNEKRLMILCHLLHGERSVQELQEATRLGQSTVSQQLAVLRGERIVKFRRDAQSVFYSIDSPEVAAMLNTLHDIYCDK